MSKQDLKDFTNNLNQTLFSDDCGFQNLIQAFQGASEAERLQSTLLEWQSHIPYWDSLACEGSKTHNQPKLEKYDRVGLAQDRIVLPLQTRLLRTSVVKSGIFNNQSEFEKFAKIYLLSQVGESGTTCPLACTDGLIRVLEAEGSAYLQNKYLAALKSIETPLAGAQFVTEQTGGSDVGAIEAIAKPIDGDTYQITAEKWYCSTPEEFFLVAARIEGAEAGTKGLSIFFVPRQIKNPDAKGLSQINNHFSIKRLKDKLGTQSLPTAEIDFNGSEAYCIGHATEGFSNLMNYVLNCSRLHNAANALGFHRRAFTEARHYALKRVAFGQNIMTFPLVAEMLVDLLSELTAHQTLFCHTIKQIDDHGWLPDDKDQRLWQRFLINTIKYRTSVKLTESVKNAILVFGANGTINDFSILPRLLRDAIVLETWEGTHNTLCMQITRDLHRFDLLEKLNQEIESCIAAWPEDLLVDSKKIYLEFFEYGQKIFSSKNLFDTQWLQTHAKRFVDHFAILLEVGLMVGIGAKQDDANILIQASHLVHQVMTDAFSDYSSLSIKNLSGICQDLICEKRIDIDMR